MGRLHLKRIPAELKTGARLTSLNREALTLSGPEVLAWSAVLLRAGTRAVCLVVLLSQLFFVQTVQAATTRAATHSITPVSAGLKQSGPSPTPSPSSAPDQTKPSSNAGATAPTTGQTSSPTSTQQATSATNSSGLRREVFGYATAGSLSDSTIGYTSWNFNLLSTVAFFSIKVRYDGQLVGDSNFTVWDSSTLTGLVSTAHSHGVKVVVTITGPGDAVDLCDALYNDATTISQLMNQVKAKGVDGVNIDYEGQLGNCQNVTDPSLDTTNQALMTKLAKDMRAALDAIKPGYYLSIATYSGSAAGNDGFFNIPDLNQYVDSFFVMAYDMDYSNQSSPPLNCSSFCMAPVSPLANYYWNDTTSMSQYSSVVGAGKTILGQPYYGRVACVSSPADHAKATGPVQAATYTGAAAVSGSPDVKPGTFATHRDTDDPNGQDRWDSWYDLSLNCWRVMYWSDTTTLGARYNLVNQMNLRGVGVWTLNYGGGAPELWTALQTYFESCYSLNASVQPGSPQYTGTSVTITASAGCPDPNPLYEFWILAPGASNYQLAQAYSTTSTYTWSTGNLAGGTYRFSIWARDANSTGAQGNKFGTWDTYNNNVTYNLVSSLCTGVGASASPGTASAIGTAVNVTATATNCPNPQYQFWVLAPGASSYQLAQAYSSNATYAWSTSGIAPGTYRFSIWARDTSSSGASGNQLGRWDAYNNGLTYTLTSCSSVGVSFAPASPSEVGKAVTVTAHGSGCANPQYQFWMLAPGAASYQQVEAYSTSNTYSWSPSNVTPGIYVFSIWVRDANSSGANGNQLGRWDAYATSSYSLSTCTGLNVNASRAVANTVTLTATASGCSSPDYQFWILSPSGGGYQLLQAYSANGVVSWSTIGQPAGTYRISVWVRDAQSWGANSNQYGTWDAYNNNTAFTLP
jgi:spore germination protein YaaH